MNLNDPLDIESIDITVNESNVIFFGCSFTDGVGLEKNQRYSTLIANYFNKNEINLAKSGHGNYRTFDLFSQCNFSSENTIVVLQLTELSRIRWYREQVIDIMLSNNAVFQQLDKKTINFRHIQETYNDKFCIYDLIRQLRILISFCRAKKLKLVIWSIARFHNEQLNTTIEEYLNKFPEYIYMNSELGAHDSYRVDNSSDGTEELGTGHPGPKSNKIIAQKLIAHIEKLYYTT
jgi:hypothetical protein